MKVIRFSRLFVPAMVFSALLLIGGVTSLFLMGFRLGVDFQAGVIQEVQFAPTAFSLTWSGRGNASIAFDRSGMFIVHSGVGVESRSIDLLFSEYPTVGALTQALGSELEGLDFELNVPTGTNSQWLVRAAQRDPQLGSVPYLVHYLDPQSAEISIATVREALDVLEESVVVQSMGQPADRHFMIRLEDMEGEGIAPADRLTSALEDHFGAGEVVVLRSDFVGSRFARNLTDQIGILITLTLLLILAYVAIRFKLQYATGAVLGIVHDSLVVIAFVVWTRMEFNTSTIAAILTILGYSVNNTIVVFDRLRENRRLYPDDLFVDVVDRSLNDTLKRTIITTLTTMLAVMSLFIFTTGAMKDFALALLVGMTSGVYTTIFIASGVVNFWETQRVKREKEKLAAQPSRGSVKATAKA